MATDCITQVTFEGDGYAKPVVARFDVPHDSTDGGLLLLKALDTRLRFTQRLAACRNAGSPCWNPYLLYAGSARASVMAAMAIPGGGVSLSPAPRSITSTPDSTSRRLMVGISASG